MLGRVIWVVALLVGAAAVVAEDEASRPIRFARQPSLSPDGKQLAFSYLGDVWTVAASGGTATRLTIHEAHEQLPAWSPDGKQIAFSSKREGRYDVWVMPAGGGRPRRLTFHSADDLVNGWSPDGKQVLFSSSRETTRTTSLYSVDVESGAVRRVATDDVPLSHGGFTRDGRHVAATRAGAWSRKGYRGSANGNLILFPTAGGPGEWLVREPENERWPLFAPDGRTFYYVSDRSGTANLWRGVRTGGRPVQVTRHRDGNVLFPTLSFNGERIVYEHDFSLWSLGTGGGEPVRLRIYAPTDDRTNARRRETFTTGAQEARLSPDGKQIAFVVHGEVFLQPAAGGETVRLTDTPQREEDLAWSPDGAMLALTSDRDGNSDLYGVVLKTKETRRFTNTPGLAEHSPAFSPDGKHLAFLRGFRGEELCVAAAGGGEPRVLVRDPAIGSFAWSPDSKWIAYDRTKSHSAGSLADIFLVRAEGGKPVNVTRYPVLNSRPAWTRDGKYLHFLSNRSGNTNLWRVSLAAEDESPAAPAEEMPPAGDADRVRDLAGEPAGAPAAAPAGARPAPGPAAVEVDLEEIHRRARPVTRVESGVGSYAITPDGKMVLFTTSQLGRPDLWRVPAAGGTPARVTQTGEAARGLEVSPDGAKLHYLASGSLKTVAPASSTPATVSFSAAMEIDTRAELLQMFDEAWRKTRDAFYDEKMHGADWQRVRESYRPVIADITYKEDFYALFSLALGELNASHTGLSGSTGPGAPATGSLGVEFDDTHAGPGVRIRSVMRKGPADRDASRLKPGEFILKVDGRRVTGNESIYELLADRAGKQVELLVHSEPNEAGARTVRLRPISGAQYRALEYDSWVRERERQVEQASGGRLGYLHLSSMNSTNLEMFKRAVFGDMQEKVGLVIDVRFNGGGSIADEILAIMQDRVFSYRTMRGDPKRLTAPLTAWTRPTIVLINESSFSNAEVFPWGYRALGLGKVVGVPTHGAVIGTGGTTLIDGSSLRLPGLGSYTLDGLNMENNGCPPDIHVENTPEDTHAGRDRQLERAVAELVKQLRS